MSTFADLMTTTAVPLLTGFFGDSGTYYSDDTGDTTTITAILERDVQNPLDATGAEYQTRITIAASELSGVTPRRNDVITVGSERFIVLSRAANDGYLVQLVVRPGDT